jgi:hypothetical protein
MTHTVQDGTTSGNNSRQSQRDDQGPPHPSAHLPRVCLGGHTWETHALSRCTPIRYGRITSVSVTHEATQFGDSICPVCDTGGGYHLGALNFRSDHSHSFSSSILPFFLIAPPSLQLCQLFDHLAKPHRTSIDRKCPIASGFQPHDFYR